MTLSHSSKSALFALAVLATGCTVPDRPVPSSRIDLPTAFEQAAGDEAEMTPEALARWWESWHDPALDQLIDQALAANSDIEIARARVSEARALVTIAQSALLPTVGAEGGALTTRGDWRLGHEGVFQLLPDPGPGGTGAAAGISARWEPDIFGGREADAAAASAGAAAIEAQLAGARMIVAAEVAQTYFEAQGTRRRLQILDGTIAALNQLAAYVEARFEAGQATSAELSRVREQIRLALADRPILSERIEIRRRRLAVLCGRPPEASPAVSDAESFILPPAPAGQMPSAVIERRPDIAARAHLVRARTAALASAKTDLLPRFSILFLGGDGHLGFDGLPGLNGTAGLIGLSATLPIFTAGRIHANIAANDARLDTAAADYDKAVLQALAEIEDAYDLRHGLDSRAAAQSAALDLARRNEGAATGLYDGGRKTLQDRLEARLDVFAREDDLVQTRIDQTNVTVRLYLSLGGGWSTD